MLRSLISIGIVVLASSLALADVPSRAHAVRRDGAVAIDGVLDDAAWTKAPTHTGFSQRFPKDGAVASMETRFAMVYDDDALYVGVWLDDPEPAKIRRLLTRRDVDVLADAILIGIDSYHDRRTGYVFQLNAAGVQRDFLVFDDTQSDDTWDAVWTGNAAVTAKGWTAEFRIPLNQLRFTSREAQEWGFQVVRIVGRTKEESSWARWPRSVPEVVSRFGTVDGIDHIASTRRIELLPYASSGFGMVPVAAGDPINDNFGLRGNLGLDAKIGLGTAFTLSATLNPDFGQVEADPSQVNLSANELFFAEKRPFFLEGVDLFKLPIGTGDNSVEGAFYSRRIGAAPREPDADYDFIRAPTSSTIYGAAKLSGKTAGWSVGVLDAVTGEETATIVDASQVESKPIVAPLTNYAVGRLKRDLNEGRTSIGVSATAVNRQLDSTPLISELHDQAYTGGLQLQHRFGTSAWQANASTVGSWVHGSADAIARTQRNPRHFYQRPDATNAHFDPTRTSLAGLGASWKVGKFGDTKHVRYGTGGDLRTIGLDLNDLGFQNHSDRLIQYVLMEVRDDEPGDDVLNWNVNGDVFWVSTLEPRLTDLGFECNGSAQLVNYWQFNAGCNLDHRPEEPSWLRGGPSLKLEDRVQGYASFTTDTRKSVYFNVGAYGGREWVADQIDGGFDLGTTIQARSNIDINVTASVSSRNDPMQYVDEVQDTQGQTHYVFARIRQRTGSLTLRVNWTFSPRLSLQAYAQPFVASGQYSELKDIDNPRADRYADRFTPIDGASYMLADGTYTVRTSGASYQFGRPDFDFRQLRSTVVVRWEYRPGSTVFAIWSHGRTSESAEGRFQLGRDLRGLADAEGEHVVMVKANYWIGL
jgi:hypothetical protein